MPHTEKKLIESSLTFTKDFIKGDTEYYPGNKMNIFRRQHSHWQGG